MRQGKDVLVHAVVGRAAGTEAGIVESDLSRARLADLAAIASTTRFGTGVFLRFGLGNGSWGWSSRLRGNGLRLRLRSRSGRLRGNGLRLRLGSGSLGLGLGDISCFFRGIWDDWGDWGCWLLNRWRLLCFFLRRRLRLSCSWSRGRSRSRSRSRVLGGRVLLRLVLILMGVKVGMLVIHVVVDLGFWRGGARVHPDGGGNIDSLDDNIGNSLDDKNPLFKGHSRGERQDRCEDSDGESFHLCLIGWSRYDGCRSFVGRGLRICCMDGLAMLLLECNSDALE